MSPTKKTADTYLWCEERIVGLTLIHGNSQQHSKPRVFVVAEPAVHVALSSDLELDVYPECFDYDTFVKASLSKSISTNNAIVIVSDSLSQRVAPLEAVIALVRNNVILIPWKSTESEIGTLNVASSSPRPTPNTLRRTIFQHAGMNELPPRFDGDDYIEEPPDARVMNFSPLPEHPQTHAIPQQDIVDHTRTPIDWFATPEQVRSDNPMPDGQTVEQIYEQQPMSHNAHHEYLPPTEQRRIEREELEVQQVSDPMDDAVFITRGVPVPEEESFFLPDTFSPTDTQTTAEVPVQEPTAPIEEKHTSNIDSFWHNDDNLEDRPDKSNTEISDLSGRTSAQTQEWLNSAFAPQVSEPEATTTAGAWSSPPSQNNDDMLELGNYISTTSDASAYVVDPPTAQSAPEVAFTPSDANGSQQMWTMFDTKMEPAKASASSSLSEFPDGSDHRKAISLYEPLILCVYSPKGGVGKTSISVNLAARLAYTTRLQVCIVDLDIAFGNVGTRLGLYNPTVRELLNESHIDGESLARNLVYDRRSGLFALLAPLRPETGTNRRKFSPAAYKKILSLLKERFDVVILDCPVELRDPLVSGFALTEAGQVVMVVNNEQATLLDARRAVEAMCRPKDSQRLPGLGIDPHNVGLVVNQKVDNVGREVDDIKAILGGGDPNHPSRQIDILSVIADDRQLWVGNANMGRTIATSGESGVDGLLDDIWTKILPGEASNEFESQEFNPSSASPLDEIFSRDSQSEAKKKRKRGLFKNKGEK